NPLVDRNRVRTQAQQCELEPEQIEQRLAVREPQMWRPTAGAGRRDVDVGHVRRRRRAVRDDDRRAIIATTEGHAGNVEFGARVGIEVVAGGLARGITLRTRVLEFRRWNEAAD